MIFDGTSMRIFSLELAKCYEAFSQGTTAQLEPLPLRYVDFAQWQRQSLQGEPLQQALSSGAPIRETLRASSPGDRPPAPQRGRHSRRTASFYVSAMADDGLKHLAHDYGVTLSPLCSAHFKRFWGFAPARTTFSLSFPSLPATRRHFAE